MIAAAPETYGFMFGKKHVWQRGITIPPFAELAKHSFPPTFTTGKPDVSRVRQYGDFAKHTKLPNTPHRLNVRMMGKGVLR